MFDIVSGEAVTLVKPGRSLRSKQNDADIRAMGYRIVQYADGGRLSVHASQLSETRPAEPLNAAFLRALGTVAP